VSLLKEDIMKALLVPPLILLSSALAFGQIVVFPNRVTTVEKLPPELGAYREAARRLSGSSSRPCEGVTREGEVQNRAQRALMLEMRTKLNPDDYHSEDLRLEVLNRFPFLTEPPALKEVKAAIKKAYNAVSEEFDLSWFAWAGRGFVSLDWADQHRAGWDLHGPILRRYLAWTKWLKGKPDLCFEQVEQRSDEDELPCDGEPALETPLLVTPEGLILALGYCGQEGATWASFEFLPQCGSPFARAASEATVYAPDPSLNGVVIRFRNPVRGSRLWFLPAWGGKLQPLKTYKPKLPTSR